jgi:tRNA(Ile)-lysidine synthase
MNDRLNDQSNEPSPSLGQRLEASWPRRMRRGCRIVVAVSGGADSVALLRLLDESTPTDSLDAGQDRVIIAHFNHAWRGEQSRQDQEFVGELARQLDWPFVTATADRSDQGDAKSEESARNARYRFLQQVAKEHGARYVATGHTADDQVETILHRVIRGTGLTGLTGIPKTRTFDDDFVLIRPLLAVQRVEIEAYLAGLGQPWRHDSTNDSSQWTRNRLRLEVLPGLRADFDCGVDGSLLQLAQTAAAALEALEPQISEIEGLVRDEDAGFCVPVLPDALPFLLTEALRRVWRRFAWPQRDMTATHWHHLAEVVRGQRQSCNLPGNIRATCDRKAGIARIRRM